MHTPGLHGSRRSSSAGSSAGARGHRRVPDAARRELLAPAADFDDDAWQDDTRVFLEACRRFGVPAALERSRSGNGAHVWIFFAAPIPAVLARQLGCLLITDAMTHRHELGMRSYDRLFPSQDTMPKGGFGNLIALPLQHGPRQLNNTVFLDETFLPFADQWGYLSSIERVPRATVFELVDDGFNGLGKPHIVCNKQVHPREQQRLAKRLELVGVDLDAGPIWRLKQRGVGCGNGVPAECVVIGGEVARVIELSLGELGPVLPSHPLGVELFLPKNRQLFAFRIVFKAREVDQSLVLGLGSRDDARDQITAGAHPDNFSRLGRCVGRN